MAKLNSYRWRGTNQADEKIQGIIQARSLLLAKVALRKQSIIPKKVTRKRIALFKKRPINQKDITVFSRQMATLTASGVSLLQSFEMIAKTQSNSHIVNLVKTLGQDITTGLTFSQALSRHPKLFNTLYCNLIAAGEQSGSLDILLNNIANYKEKTEHIKKKIKKALTYPLAVLIIACLVSAGLLFFVVPEFKLLFAELDAELPILTQYVISLSNFLKIAWYLLLGGIIIGVYSFRYAHAHSVDFTCLVDKWLLKLPVLGSLLEKNAIARFSQTLAITYAAGLPLVNALESTTGVTGNRLYASAIHKIKENVSSGQLMHLAMMQNHLFPPMMVQMIAIGEESGRLELMLNKVASMYDDQVDGTIDALNSLLEPIIMALLGLLVGTLVIAMYLPIFKLGSVI